MPDRAPRTDDQRRTCIEAAEACARAPDVHPAILGLLHASVLPAVDALRSAWREVRAASAAVDDATAGVLPQEVSVKASFRRFIGSISDEAGRARPDRVAQVLGGILPYEIHRKDRGTRIGILRILLEQAETHAEIAGAPDLRAALADDLAAFETCCAALNEARERHHAAVIRLVQARKSFDPVWLAFVRVAIAHPGPLTPLLPTFSG